MRVQHSLISINDSLHFQKDTRVKIFDGFPRKLWNKSDSLFYHSRDSNLRILDTRGTFGSISTQLIILAFSRNGEPRCFVFDRREYPKYAAKLLTHVWSEHYEGWVPESPELSILDRYTSISQGVESIAISASINYGVIDSISSKRIWTVTVVSD